MNNIIECEPNLVRSYLEEGKSKTVEFKEKISDPSALARYLSAFANGEGGTVLVGLREPNFIIGCDPTAVGRVYHRALDQLHPRPDTTFQVVQFDGKDVATISVQKSPVVVYAKDGVFTRIGSLTRPSTAHEIVQKLPSTLAERDKQGIAKQLVSLTEIIVDQKSLLEEQAEKIDSMAQSVQRVDQRSADGERLPSKLKNDVRSNSIGIAVAAVGGALVSHIPWHLLLRLASQLVMGSH